MGLKNFLAATYRDVFKKNTLTPVEQQRLDELKKKEVDVTQKEQDERVELLGIATGMRTRTGALLRGIVFVN